MKLIFKNVWGGNKFSSKTEIKEDDETYIFLNGDSEDNSIIYSIHWSLGLKGFLIKEYTNNPDDLPPFDAKLVRTFEDLKLFFKDTDNNLDDFKEMIEKKIAEEVLREI
jgi:hypothetical protein